VVDQLATIEEVGIGLELPAGESFSALFKRWPSRSRSLLTTDRSPTIPGGRRKWIRGVARRVANSREEDRDESYQDAPARIPPRTPGQSSPPPGGHQGWGVRDDRHPLRCLRRVRCLAGGAGGEEGVFQRPGQRRERSRRPRRRGGGSERRSGERARPGSQADPERRAPPGGRVLRRGETRDRGRRRPGRWVRVQRQRESLRGPRIPRRARAAPPRHLARFRSRDVRRARHGAASPPRTSPSSYSTSRRGSAAPGSSRRGCTSCSRPRRGS